MGGGDFFGRGIFWAGDFFGAGGFCGGGGFLFGGEGFPLPNCFFAQIFYLGYPPNFNFLGKPLLGEKYVHGRKKEEKRTIMPSLVTTTYTPARKPFVRTHSVYMGGWGGGGGIFSNFVSQSF